MALGPELDFCKVYSGLVLVKCCCQFYSSEWLEIWSVWDVDDMTSPIKFSDGSWPSFHFTYPSVFCRLSLYELVCKIVYLWYIDLKFSGQISHVKMNNPTKFCKVTMSRRWIYRKQAIWLSMDFANSWYTY